MTILVTVLSYAISFFVAGLINRIMIYVSFAPGRFLVSFNKKLQYPLCFFYGVSASFLGVYGYVAISDNTALHLTWLIILIPSIILILNDLNRINNVKKGESGMKRVLIKLNDEQSYSEKIDLMNERIVFYSRVIGYLIAVILFLQNEPLF